RFKDYISLPKNNGYRSLHTEVIGPNSQRIEIQIRTHEMHEIAEQGIAAHWQYKRGNAKPDHSIERYPWLKEMLEILEHSGDVGEFLEHTKIDMYESQVFVFSPAGDLYVLPKGASVIDFAYAVHTSIGDRCMGCKINGRIMPLRTLLENGDQIEIQTRKIRKPSPGWLGFVSTGKARSCINRFIRESGRDDNIQLGKSMLTQKFQDHHLELHEKSLQGVLRHYAADHLDDLYERVGVNRISATEILFAVHPSVRPSAAKKSARKERARAAKPKSSDAIAIDGFTAGMAYQLAKCCHPLPGDSIVGIVATGKGISVHTADCKTLGNFSDMPERWVDIRWNRDDDDLFVGRLHVTLMNRQGALHDLTAVVGRESGNIHNLKFSRREEDFFDVMIDIEVENSQQLERIIASLRMTEVITQVDRP
ncbi:MAG: RelA/SpoT AH/RIS domain-containing protein, partial [Pseudomonadota bacterium]